jgi:aryl-alcohol dehydrogenase-like predicted oxidoreductase
LKANPGQRRNLVLATKMFGCMDGLTPNHCGLSRSNILDSVYASLERLQTDHIDILYFHAVDPITPVEEGLMAVEDLIGGDLIRYFGLSNVTTAQLEIYRNLQREVAPRCRIVAVQNGFDVLHGEQKDAKGVLLACAEEHISFIAYSPLAGGLLTGRYLDPSKARKGDRLVDEGTLERVADAKTVHQLKMLAQEAESMGCELSQLVLAYMLTLPGMGPVIPGVTSIQQLESNAKARLLRLGEEQIARIQSILG